jgi:hypothetical protein
MKAMSKNHRIPASGDMQAAIDANIKAQVERAKPGSLPPVVDPRVIGPIHSDDALPTDEDLDNIGNRATPENEDIFGPRLAFDGAKETLSTFALRINEAKLNGDEWIETTKRVFDHIVKSPSPYLMYEGIKVFIVGTRKEIEKQESLSIDERLRLEQEKARIRKADGVSA